MLTKEELDHFDRNGFVRCGAIADSHGMDEVRSEVDMVLQERGCSGQSTLHRHLDSRVIYRLCSHRAVVERVAALLGPDLLLWHSRIFDKPAGSGRVPWHQDMPFWQIEPDTCVSAWIAIDRADAGNSCVEVIPGSHRTKAPHVASEGTGRFRQMVDPAFVAEAAKVTIELDPGEFILFDRWLVHGSPPNSSGRRRLGVAARYIPPAVKVDYDQMSPQFPELGVQVVRGADTARRSRVAPPPPR